MKKRNLRGASGEGARSPDRGSQHSDPRKPRRPQLPPRVAAGHEFTKEDVSEVENDSGQKNTVVLIIAAVLGALLIQLAAYAMLTDNRELVRMVLKLVKVGLFGILIWAGIRHLGRWMP
jgi:hypothetical protein